MTPQQQETLKMPLSPLPSWGTQEKTYEPAPSLLTPPPVPTLADDVMQAIATLTALQQQQSAQQSAVVSRPPDKLPMYLAIGACCSFTAIACTAILANSLPNASVSDTQKAQLQMMEQMAKRQPTQICIAFSCPPPVVQPQPVQYVAPVQQYPAETLSVGQPVVYP